MPEPRSISEEPTGRYLHAHQIVSLARIPLVVPGVGGAEGRFVGRHGKLAVEYGEALGWRGVAVIAEGVPPNPCELPGNRAAFKIVVRE